MQQKVLKTGNSLAVTIPSRFAKIMGVKPGDTVRVKTELQKSSLTLTFSGSGQLSLLTQKK
jgi:antitoxin component of MazEF toxin-antitoxin module